MLWRPLVQRIITRPTNGSQIFTRLYSWTPVDIDILMRRVMVYGDNWEKVSRGLDKSPDECRSCWDDQNRDNSWSIDKMQNYFRIISILNGSGQKIQWDEVAEFVQSKSAEECQQFHQRFGHIFGWNKMLTSQKSTVEELGSDEDDFKFTKWSRDDTRRLRSLVASAPEHTPEFWSLLSKRFGNISIEKLQEKVTSMKLRARKRLWSPEEKKELYRLVEKYGTKWNIITEYLPGRTATQCKLHYHTTSGRSKTGLFSTHEHTLLKTALEQYKDETQKKWTKVASMIPGRNASQCRRAAVMYLSTRKGLWSKDEDKLLQKALNQVGPQWSKVANLVPDRHPLQCRERWITISSEKLKGIPFMKEEIRVFLQLIAKHGPKWSLIASELGTGRTRKQLEKKFRQLLVKKEWPGDNARKIWELYKTNQSSNKCENGN